MLDSHATDGPGQRTVPNPGEQPPDWQEKGMPTNSLGAVPATGNRAGGGSFMDNGATVGYKRNLEFSSGGRSQLVSTGTTSTARPYHDPETGQTQVSGVTGDDQTAGQMGEGPTQAGSDPHGGDPPTKPDRPPGEAGDMARGPDSNSPGPSNEARRGRAAPGGGR